MTRTPVRVLRAGVVLFTGLLLALAALGPVPDVAAVALVAAGLLILATARGIAVAAPRSVRVGHRDRAHEESLAELCAPAHPDTDGRVRSRAPGSVARTA